MIQLKSEDFVFDEPKQSSQRRWFPARGASNEVQRLSDLFELPFLGHRSLQRRTINSIYLALSSLCLSFRLLAEGAYERAGDPLRGSPRQPPIQSNCFSKTTTWRQAADTKPDCLQTQRLSKNNRVLCSLAGARDEHPLIQSRVWPRRVSFSRSRSWGSGKLVGQTNKMPCNYFKLLTQTQSFASEISETPSQPPRDSLLVHTDTGHNTAETRRPGSLPWPVIHKIRKTSGIISALCRGGDLSGTKEKKWGWESSRTHRPTTLWLAAIVSPPMCPLNKERLSVNLFLLVSSSQCAVIAICCVVLP